jgi:hypothetical protein
MQTHFEILIPLRNPTDVFGKTVESLTTQTDRNFSVLISDNFSTKGLEHIESALKQLSAAGIAVRKIQPSAELGRVEHWNWIHYQAGASWLKPLFVGDWLEPEYVATVREVPQHEPACGYVYCGFRLHRDGKSEVVMPGWTGRFFPPREMQDVVMRYAMQFGPPSAAAYRQDVFLKSGGYEPSLPICADSLLFCKLAARNGAYGVPAALVNFSIHAARFSHELPDKRRELFRENSRYFGELGITAWHERWQFPKIGYLRLIARGIRTRFKEPHVPSRQ